MNRFSIALAALAILFGNRANAQTDDSLYVGENAQYASSVSTNNYSWTIGVGGLAVLGVIVGFTIAGSLQDQNTFSH